MDIPSLLKLLNENKVRFIIVGATAFPVHGYVRDTLDIDIFIEPVRENAERTYAALKAFGYDVTDLSADELLEKKALFRGYVVETDIHPFLTGIGSFEEIWSHRIQGAIGGIPVFFADLDSLIRMKVAAGRPKDLEDLKYLRELKKSSPRLIT